MADDRDQRSVEEVRQKVDAAYAAFLQYRSFSQERVDEIVAHVAAVARANSARLAQLAVEETGYGNVKDKTAKNLLGSDTLHRYIAPLKTAGIVRRDEAAGIIEIAEPMGVVAAILPTTNPTSTAIYKVLISLKARNAVVLSPHPRARRCTCETAALLAAAAEEAGAPKGIVQCANEATIGGTNELMRHKRTSVILATGGPGIVRAAYASGKPALGVGPGNVPVLIDSTANLDDAIRQVIDGKSFDYGTLCSSEQSIVVEAKHRDDVWRLLKSNDAYVCNQQQSAALEKLLITEGFRINPECVGQAAPKIAKMAGFTVAETTRVLALELKGIGRQHPLSAEKLSPVLSVLFVNSFDEAITACQGILNFGGRGHTCGIYSTSKQNVEKFALAMPAFRVLVNTPTPQGSTGITTNVAPAMTLGCGAIAGNATSDNVGPLNLINLKRVAFKVRETSEAFESKEGRAYLANPSTPPAPPPKLVTLGGPPQRPGDAVPERPAIASAVEKYLASRGVASAKAYPKGTADSSLRSVVEGVVDSFLAGSAPSATPAPVEQTPAAEPSPPPAPTAVAVGFVCEDDVRRARTKGEQIYVNKKTIITPAARDLASSSAVLVETE
ncbi:MAG: aldehyde dehydrogenase family protein [Acidobacteria bacterium]|nr:aldehyde dehydrogenase family protein [Acidobacteriota bacterium]MDA1233686.1 aldehyde dehydrogenase family protein [Acidobacteriota bacterium]